MLRKQILSVLGMGMLASCAWSYTGFGLCNFGKESVDHIICYGPTILKETTVTGDVKIAGSLKASLTTLKNLIVAGTTDLDNVTIEGNAEVEGSLFAKSVHFQQQLILRSDNATLENSSVQSAVTISSSVNKPYLKLFCGSKVLGPVIFEGATGVVQITDDSTVQGKLVNGQMEFVKKTCA